MLMLRAGCYGEAKCALRYLAHHEPESANIVVVVIVIF